MSNSLIVQTWSVKPAAMAGVCRFQRPWPSCTQMESVSTGRVRLYTPSSHVHAASSASNCLE
jgi:hypothetical protein